LLVDVAKFLLPKVQLFVDFEAIAELFLGLLVLFDIPADAFLLIIAHQTQLDPL
jgi:hypothetical protein